MPLTGRQIQQIRDALLDAFPSRDELRMLAHIELDQNLDAIAGGDNLRVVVFNLVTWAERTGCIDQLIAGACAQNPGNSALQLLAKDRQAQTAAQPGPSPAQAAPAPVATGPTSIDLFLSYSRHDAAAMRQVLEILRDASLAVWTDEGLEPGTEHWQAAIQEAIAEAKALVVLLSPDAKTSVWVNREISYAQALGKRVFPVLIAGDERSAVPITLIDAQRVDGCQDLRHATRQALRPALLRHLGRPPAAPPIEFDWVTIPAGKFLMGSDKKKDESAYDDETPQHTVDVAEFRIARVPVTIAQFAAFVKATGYRTTAEELGKAYVWSHPSGPDSSVANKQNHPVTCVSWDDAQAFCKWAGVLPPTEAQWEKAARGTDGRIYPWGNTPLTKDLCNFSMIVGDTTPVGSYPKGASPYGVLDMAGNVWEWTSSESKPYPYDANDGREDPGGERRVLRGGS